MLGIPAASRKSSSPAWQRTPVAGAEISRVRLPVKPTRAGPTKKSDVPPHQPLDLAEVLAKLAAVLAEFRSARSLEEEFRVDQVVATTETEFTEVLNGGCPGTAYPTHPSRVSWGLSLRRTKRECGKI